MIGKLSGTLAMKRMPWVLIDIGGVGYELQVPTNTFSALGDIGSVLSLWVHTQIKEDAHDLFGFFQESERAMFRTLIKISGVGPKMALTILSGVGITAFINAVETQDVQVLTKLPGVGRKTAERLMVELRDKLKRNVAEWQQWSQDTPKMLNLSADQQPRPKPQLGEHSAFSEAVAALVSLGYKSQEAHQAVLRVLTPEADSQTLIRQALQSFVKI